MPTSAVLDELIDALEMQSDSLFVFLDRETGEVEEISEESLSLSEAEPEEIDLLPDWQKEEASCGPYSKHGPVSRTPRSIRRERMEHHERLLP